MWTAKRYHRGCEEPTVLVTDDLLRILQLAAADYKTHRGEYRWTVTR